MAKKKKISFELAKFEYYQELKGLMEKVPVEFKYLKADGTQRTAHGTLCHDLIPASDQPTGRGTFNGYEKGYAPYYDLDRMGWRCFRIDWLLWFNRDNEEKGGAA